MIDLLRKQLKSMEDSKRFSGNSYPEGYEPFPKALIGQGFFPGGDGLWRENEPNRLREPSPYPFPMHGIMFLGNDFGSLAGFSKLKAHENPPTWRNLRRRLSAAKIPGELGFYTNAYLGLRSDRDALSDALINFEYDMFCRDFLQFQIATQMPRLIVVLGSRPNSLLHQVLRYASKLDGESTRAEMPGFEVDVLTVSHPYSDLRKNESGVAHEGFLLQRAWSAAIK